MERLDGGSEFERKRCGLYDGEFVKTVSMARNARGHAIGTATGLGRTSIRPTATLYGVDDDTVDQIFDFMVRDFSKFAVELYSKTASTEPQMAACLGLIKKPVADAERYGRMWQGVHGLSGAYEMNSGTRGPRPATARTRPVPPGR